MKKKPLFISYYTDGNGYEIEAAQLVETLEKFNLDFRVCPAKPFEGWQEATQFKACFIEQMMSEHSGRPLVWNSEGTPSPRMMVLALVTLSVSSSE